VRQGAVGKAGARKGSMQSPERDGRGVGACKAAPFDGLSTAGMAVPCSVSCPCLGWEGRQKAARGTCVIPGTRHPWSLSSTMLLHFILQPGFLIKLKSLSAGALGQRLAGVAGAAWDTAVCGCLLPALTWLSRKRLQQGRPDLSHTWTRGREIQAEFFSVDYRAGEACEACQRNFLHDTGCPELVLV